MVVSKLRDEKKNKIILANSSVKKKLKEITTKPTPKSSRVTRKRTRMAATTSETEPKKGLVNIIKTTQGKRLMKW